MVYWIQVDSDKFYVTSDTLLSQTSLHAMDQAEQAFVKTFLNTISSQPVTYADDYQQPPELSLRKVPVLPVS
jgi:hypothetical protein